MAIKCYLLKPEDIARFFEQDKISDIHSLLENLGIF
jgi:hypothetical protein